MLSSLLRNRFLILAVVSSMYCIPLTAAPDNTPVPKENSQNKTQDPPRIQDSSSSDDHGFMFPLEDLVDKPDKTNDRFYLEFFNMLATLGFVIGIILIAAWLLKRILNTRLEQINTTSAIKIIEKRSLSPKSAVYLLEIFDKTIAIAETQNGIFQLGEFKPSGNIEGDDDAPPSSFANIMEKKQ